MSVADSKGELEARLAAAAGSPMRPHEAQALNALESVLFGEPAAATTVDRYVLEDKLGQGAAGSVYRARDPKLERSVAIKLLVADERSRVESRARFDREARALAQLSHPNIVNVYDVGEHESESGDHSIFIVMELVDGPTMREWLETERDWREVRDLLVKAGTGLAAAHAAGLVHRDFKPSNVLIGADGRPRVADFGLVGVGATPADQPDPNTVFDDDGLTRRGRVMGTPGYMAPEVLRGEAADARSDQFSFCVTLYEGLFGRRPFVGTSIEDRLQSIESGPRLPAQTTVPARLGQALSRGLSARPDQRWPDMAQLLAALGDPPRRGWIWGALAVATVAGAMAVTGGNTGASRAMGCQESEDLAARIWNRDRRTHLQEAFAEHDAEDEFTRLAPIFDAFAENWTLAHAESCRATRIEGSQSPKVFTLRGACLDDRLDELDSLLSALESADAAAVRRSPTAARALTPVESCEADAVVRDQIEPPPGAVADAVGVLQNQLRDLKALEDLGRYSEAISLADQTVIGARDTGYVPVLSEALLRIGILHAKLGDAEKAEAELAEGYWTALSVSYDRFAVANAIQLVVTVGQQPGRAEEGMTWAQHASALIERAEIEPIQEGHLLNNVGAVLWLQGRHDEALTTFEDALEVQTQALGSEHPELANILNNMGNIHIELGDHDSAARRYREAIALRERTLGPDHPKLASPLGNLASVQLRRGELEEARDLYERAIASTEVNLGDEHPRLVGLRSNLGSLELAAGDEARAIELFEGAARLADRIERPALAALPLGNLGAIRAERDELPQARLALERAHALTREASGDEHLSTIRLVSLLADITRREGDLDGAQRELLAAVDQLENSVGRDHPELALPLWSLAEIELTRGDASAALGLITRGLSAVAGDLDRRSVMLHLEFARARALDLSGDTPGAREALARTRKSMDAHPTESQDRLRDKLDNWARARDLD